MGPFLFVSLFTMRGPVFPPHPHAGFSVASYLLPESPIGFINQDSLGTRNRIAPGALHVTRAGRGMLHEEQPERTGSAARGYQIWIDHAEADRELPPAALHLAASEVPRLEFGGSAARVVLGECMGVRAPVSVPAPARIVDLDLMVGAPVEFALDPADYGFLVVLDGAVQVADRVVGAGDVAATLRAGAAVRLAAVDAPARATLFAGRAASRQRVRQGPFVANDQAQLQRFFEAYRSGGFGSLNPFAEQR
jgi:redox-sensitive bicupin YhaK (pirin superfamily)